MKVIDTLACSESGRLLLVNIADALAEDAIDPAKLRLYFQEVEAATDAGRDALVAAQAVTFAGYGDAGGPRYHFLCGTRGAASSALCTFVTLPKLQALIRAAGALRDVIEADCADAALTATSLAAAEASALARAVTRFGAEGELWLQAGSAGRRFPQWFTTVDETLLDRRDWRVADPDDTVATAIRDRLALGHMLRGTQLFAFVSPAGWTPPAGAGTRPARPLFWDAIDQKWFRHRFAPACTRGWGRTLDMRHDPVDHQAGASEMVVPGVAFEPGFICRYIGELVTTLDDLRILTLVLGDRSLDQLVDRVRAALHPEAA